nr:hypothetical protein BaRGS_003068 [Batillaria attramentaria]
MPSVNSVNRPAVIIRIVPLLSVFTVDRLALCQDLDIPPTADPVDYCLCSDNMSDASTPHRLALLHTAPDLAYLAGPPGTGKTLTAVIMGVEWMRRNKTVNILSGDRKSRAAAHHIKQQLEETARLVIGPQAASRVRLHLVHLDEYGAKLAANVDKLVKTLASSATNNEICLIADEASCYSLRMFSAY